MPGIKRKHKKKQEKLNYIKIAEKITKALRLSESFLK